MNKTFNIAVVGATGAVGTAMLDILSERNFPAEEVYPLASKKSVGKTVMFGKKSLAVQNLATFDFLQVDIALFSAGGNISKIYAPKVVEAGAVVIDNSSQFRYEKDIPLVVPEVNPDDIAQFETRGIIANPNCSTIQMLVALKPIYDAVGIKRVTVSTYQSVSGSGQKGVDELASQTSQLLNAKEAEVCVYAKQIAFNVLPHIDEFQDNGSTREEMKMIWETQKILGDKKVKVNPTAVRVPVFYGHSEAINIETKKPLSALDAKTLLKTASGITVVESDQDYPTAFTDGTNTDDVFVGRIRQDLSLKNGLNLWVVSDNIRKGAALNAVQIAEILISKYW